MSNNLQLQPGEPKLFGGLHSSHSLGTDEQSAERSRLGEEIIEVDESVGGIEPILKVGYQAPLRKENTPQREKWREYNRRRAERRRREKDELAVRMQAVKAAEPVVMPEACIRCRIECDIISRECRLKEGDVYRLRPDLILDFELMEKLEAGEVEEGV